MSKIYIAVCITGEYEDYRRLKILAFLDKTQCDKYVEKLNDWAVENNVHDTCGHINPDNIHCPLYPKGKEFFSMGGYGVDYATDEVDLYSGPFDNSLYTENV